MSDSAEKIEPSIDAEASPIIAGTSPVAKKPRWDMKGRRNLIIVGVIILVAFAASIAMFSGGKTDVAPKSDIPVANNPDEKGIQGEEDKERQRQEEARRLEDAKRSKKSAIESNGRDPEVVDDATAPNSQKAETNSSAGSQKERLDGNGQGQKQNQGPDERMKATTDQVRMMMTAWGLSADKPSNDSSRLYERDIKTAANNPGQQAGSTATAGTQGSAADDPVVIEAFQTAYSAETLTNFDSDAPTKARARILTGPLAGAVLTGTSQRMGDGAHFEYTLATFKGKPFKINAEAVDEKTASEMIEGNYNGRYAQRFIFPIISEGVKAYAQAKAQTGTQVVVVAPVNGSGVAAQATPAPTSQQAVNAMFAAGAEQTSKALSTTNQQSQVTVDMKKLIGIRFIDSVYASDVNGTKK